MPQFQMKTGYEHVDSVNMDLSTRRRAEPRSRGGPFFVFAEDKGDCADSLGVSPDSSPNCVDSIMICPDSLR